MIDTFEYNLKNVLLLPLLESTNNFVEIMTGLFVNQINLGFAFAYAFVSVIIAMGVIQIVFVVMATRLITRQAKLFLHIPLSECVKQQKKANVLIDEIRVFIFSFSFSTVDLIMIKGHQLMMAFLTQKFSNLEGMKTIIFLMTVHIMIMILIKILKEIYKEHV